MREATSQRQKGKSLLLYYYFAQFRFFFFLLKYTPEKKREMLFEYLSVYPYAKLQRKSSIHLAI